MEATLFLFFFSFVPFSKFWRFYATNNVRDTKRSAERITFNSLTQAINSKDRNGNKVSHTLFFVLILVDLHCIYNVFLYSCKMQCRIVMSLYFIQRTKNNQTINLCLEPFGNTYSRFIYRLSHKVWAFFLKCYEHFVKLQGYIEKRNS